MKGRAKSNNDLPPLALPVPGSIQAAISANIKEAAKRWYTSEHWHKLDEEGADHYRLITDELTSIERGEYSTSEWVRPGWNAKDEHGCRVDLVARRLQLVGRLLCAFNHEDEQHLQPTVRKAMEEAERVLMAAFDLDRSEKEGERAQAAAGFDRVEHLAKVVVHLVKREAPRFMADPQAWIKKRQELGGTQS